MDKMLVVVFDNESKAYEGIKALRELHAEASHRTSHNNSKNSRSVLKR
jgi:hypothetical protein